jgi:hypothetical protein
MQAGLMLKLAVTTLFFFSLIACSEQSEVTSTRSSLKQKETGSGIEVSSTADDGTAGTTIFVPNDSDIDADNLQIQPGATVANPTTAAHLNYQGQILSTSPAVNVSLSNATYSEQVGALILTLSTADAASQGLSLTSNIQLVVFYHVYSDALQRKKYGLIPTQDLTIAGDKVSFAMRGFGNYQVAKVDQTPVAELSAETKDEIQTSSRDMTDLSQTGSNTGSASATTTGSTIGGTTSGGGTAGTTGTSTGGSTGSTSGGGSGSSTGGGADSSASVLALGANHSCAIRSGQLWCWGDNSKGQIGFPDGSSHDHPRRLDLSHDWLSVSAGKNHTCAIKSDNSLWCWGSTERGQLGIGIVDQSARFPITLVGDMETRWAKLSAGAHHTCAIDSEDKLFCWGSNSHGQIIAPASGSLAVRAYPNPAEVDSANDYLDVSLGEAHSCAIRKVDQSLWCWGDNTDGQHGHSDLTKRTADQPMFPSGGSARFSSVKAGTKHT